MTSADDSRIKDIVYKRRNGENIVNDPVAIASCKNEQSRDVIDNARLGSYDKFGNYIIIPDIKRELLSMPKLIYNVKTQDKKTVYELKSTIPIFGDVFFKLAFSASEAVLTLTETVNREANGYLEIYDEPLDSLASGASGLPQDIIFRNYHIIESPDDFGKRMGANDFNNILTRKVYLSLLSKELREVSKFDEHEAFDKMVATLKGGGEYGIRVLQEFTSRLKERPGIFEITQTEKYNKAVNEVLLSALDIATTQQDKDNAANKQTYLNVLNARNQNIQAFLDEANSRIDEAYVNMVVNKATKNFVEEAQEEDEYITAFFDRIKDKKSVPTKRKLDKPILKQGKGAEAGKSKEDKIKSILNKDGSKKTPAGKKLKAGKAAQGKGGKLKGGKKAGGKKKGKAKLKGKKKKVKKAKAPQKAKAKAGSLKAGGGKKKAKKKAAEGNITIKMALVQQNNVSAQNILPAQSAASQVREFASQPKVQQGVQNDYATTVVSIGQENNQNNINKLNERFKSHVEDLVQGPAKEGDVPPVSPDNPEQQIRGGNVLQSSAGTIKKLGIGNGIAPEVGGNFEGRSFEGSPSHAPANPEPVSPANVPPPTITNDLNQN